MEKLCKTPKPKGTHLKKIDSIEGNVEKTIKIKKEKKGIYILNVKFS